MKKMKTILGLLLTFSTVFAHASVNSDVTTIECRDNESKALVATITAPKTFPKPVNLFLYELSRSADGVLTINETGATREVSVWVGKGLVLNVKSAEKEGILVYHSGAGHIIENGYSVRDISCDGYQSNKWPQMKE